MLDHIMLLKIHGLTQMTQSLLRSYRVSLWKKESCANMQILVRQPEQEVDQVTVDIIGPFLDLTDLSGIDSVVETHILTWMCGNEMHHVFVLLKHDDIRRRWRDALLLADRKVLYSNDYPE